MNVVDSVVIKDWCVGCGMCAAVCPKHRLEMRWNRRGEYNPFEVEGSSECSENCSLCYKVCPAHGDTKNETEIGKQWFNKIEGIRYRQECGYYLSSYVGYSTKHRAAGASGGMATWTLEHLLQSGEINTVVAVGRTSDRDRLFEFKLCQTIGDLRSCSRSAYYPVEVSRVIRHILRNDGQYAIIGLPCVCKAIRLAQDSLPVLKRRIKYVLGLTCGHQSSKFFAEYICALGGGNPHELKEFIFRMKDLTQPANNHAMFFRAGKGDKEVAKQILWRDGVGFAYVNGYFQIPGCFYCDDAFAECADVSFMDAWLPEYQKHPEGHSLVLTRDATINEIIRNAAKDELCLAELSVEKILQSQQGVINQKRRRNLRANTMPTLRQNLYKRAIIIQPRICRLQMEIAKKSSLQWTACSKDILRFDKAMLPLREKLLKFQKIQRVSRLSARILGRVKPTLIKA